MPYIAPERRERLDPAIESLQAKLYLMGDEEGDLNYAITRLIASYFEDEPRYHTIARITGVLDNVKGEFERRIAAPYEDGAARLNGDVPEFKHILNQGRREGRHE